METTTTPPKPETVFNALDATRFMSYMDTTTGGPDPTQLETWVFETPRGTFTVCQYWGDYTVGQIGEQRSLAPQWLADLCREYKALDYAYQAALPEDPMDAMYGGW